jgi:hypothetical protein
MRADGSGPSRHWRDWAGVFRRTGTGLPTRPVRRQRISSADRLYVSHADGRNPILIDAGSQPAWSSDGKVPRLRQGNRDQRPLDLGFRSEGSRQGPKCLPDRGFVKTPVFFPNDQTITFVDEFSRTRVLRADPVRRPHDEASGSCWRLGISSASPPTRTRLVSRRGTRGRGLADRSRSSTKRSHGPPWRHQCVSSPFGQGAVRWVAFVYCDRTFTFPGGPCSIRVGDGTTNNHRLQRPHRRESRLAAGLRLVARLHLPRRSSVASSGGPYRLKIVGADGNRPRTPHTRAGQTTRPTPRGSQ